MRLHLGVYILAIILGMGVFGCRSHNKPGGGPTNPTPTIGTISETLKRNTDTIDEAIAKAQADAATAHDQLIVIGAANNANKPLIGDLGTVAKAVAGMQQRNDDLTKQNDTSRQGLYRLLDYSSWIGGFVLALGIALAVTGKPAGIGLAVFGGAIVGVFMTLRAASPVLVWVAAGLGVIAVVGVGYLVWEKLREWKKKRAMAENLAKEQLATKELTKTVAVVRNELPQESEQKLFGEEGVVKKEIQSDTTQALVKAARAEMEVVPSP